MTTKQAVIEIIQQLPDDATIEDILAALHFRRKVDAGLQQLDEGQGVQHDEANRRLSKWVS